MDILTKLIEFQDSIDECNIEQVCKFITLFTSRTHEKLPAIKKVIEMAVFKLNRVTFLIPRETIEILISIDYIPNILNLTRFDIIHRASRIIDRNTRNGRDKFILNSILRLHKPIELLNDYARYFRINKDELAQAFLEGKIRTVLNSAISDEYPYINVKEILGWNFIYHNNILYDVRVCFDFSVRVFAYQVSSKFEIGIKYFHDERLEEYGAIYENLNIQLQVGICGNFMVITLFDVRFTIEISSMELSEVKIDKSKIRYFILTPTKKSFCYYDLDSKYRLITYKDLRCPTKEVQKILKSPHSTIIDKSVRGPALLDAIACQIDQLDLP